MARSILATFFLEADAEQAARHLRQHGFREVQLDLVSRYPDARNPDDIEPFPPTGTGLADQDERPLVAADPSFSGNAVGGNLVGGSNFLVTVVTDEDRVEQALSIIAEHGGEV